MKATTLFSMINSIPNENAYKNDVIAMGDAIIKAETASLAPAWFAHNVFTDTTCQAIDNDCDTWAKFARKYYDKDKSWASRMAKIGTFVDRVVSESGKVTYVAHGSMKGFKLGVLQELGDKYNTAWEASTVVDDLGITPAWTVKDVRKALKNIGCDVATTDADGDADGTTTDADTDALNDAVKNADNQSTIDVINAMRALVSVLGTDNDALNQVALDLVELGYKVK